MIEPIFLEILGGLGLLILVMSFFIRSKPMLKLINVLQVILFVGIGTVAIASLMGYTFSLPKIFILSSLRAFFLLILSTVGIAITIYSTYYLGVYLEHKKNIPFYVFLALIFLFSMIGIIMTNEMITFLILREVMSLSSYFLVVHEPGKKDVLTSGARYFIITHIGFFAILFAFLPFLSQSGSTFFTTWSAATFSMATKNMIFILALIGFGSKAGMFPIHIWLPKAHPIAPSYISALMSGFMVKIPILFLFIFIQQFFGNHVPLGRGIVVLTLGGVSAFIGIFYAIVQDNIKKLLAYSTIENIGIILIGFGLFMIGVSSNQSLLVGIGMFASLYHTFNHAIFKSLLFITAGSVIERTGTADIKKLGGLMKQIPQVAVSFLIGSIAIIGLPPFNGFNSEIATIFGIIQGFTITQSVWMLTLFIAILVIIGIMSATAFYCFVKTFAMMFLGNLRDKTIKIIEKKSRSEKFSFVWLTVAIISLAILPGAILKIVYNILGRNSSAISFFKLPIGNMNYTPGILLIAIVVLGWIGWIFYKRVLKKSIVKEPWNCGYSHIVPKAQYSGSSFVQPLRRVYAGFFGEKKITTQHPLYGQQNENKLYKKQLSSIGYEIHHKYRFDIVFEGVATAVTKIVSVVKGLMNGHLSIYLAYIFIILLIFIFVFYRFY